MARRVLVNFAHPVLERSRVNRHMIEAIRDLDGVTVNDLYERYPDLSVDVRREQQLLDEHEAVVFQHPFFWYSGPAILKEWQDLVLEHGWAYGAGGTHLANKITFNAISAGAPHSAYQPGGYNRFTIRQLLTPFEQTAHLCGMHYIAPFVVFGALKLVTHAEMHTSADEYRALITALRDEQLDTTKATRAELLTPEFIRREVA
ncbi:MAG TPA: NAD(P)H-dependent oxidoreductase [Kofleriaceae bacterium]